MPHAFTRFPVERSKADSLAAQSKGDPLFASELVPRPKLLATVILLVSVCMALGDERDDLQGLELRATTKAYQEAALEVLLAEANQIARELELPERLPIKRSDLREARINTPYWAEHARQFGFVSTSNYYYYANVGNRLGWVDPNFGPDEVRRPVFMESVRKRFLRPKAQMDTNAAYAMATQWLAKVGADVPALERDAERVDISAREIGGNFVPVYLVRWQKLAQFRGDSSPPKLESVASIQFVAPERRILQMRVNQAKYIRRKALTVPDRERLLQSSDDPKLRELWFTTEAYRAAALKLMLEEVNWAARALRLPEQLPIESSDLTDMLIGTPFTADHQGCFVTVYTEKYCYGAGQKLTAIGRPYLFTGEEEHYIASLRTRHAVPRSRMNPTGAYNLATQWLAAVSVDLKRLEADYPHRITVPWDLGDYCVPLFTVEWSKPIEGSGRRDVAAMVEVLEPERSLEQLVIERPEYMARGPIVVPDRGKLLQATKEK